MTALEVARQVVEGKTAQLFRERKGEHGQYDVKDHEGSKRGWTFLDTWTASTIVQVHAKLNAENQAKFAALPLLKMAHVALKLANP